jgi:hypothetical protein
MTKRRSVLAPILSSLIVAAPRGTTARATQSKLVQ